jgi:hypothetical protein
VEDADWLCEEVICVTDAAVMFEMKYVSIAKVFLDGDGIGIWIGWNLIDTTLSTRFLLSHTLKIN